MSRFWYSRIKAMASTSTGEFAVLGLVVGDESGWRVLSVGDRSRAVAFCGEKVVLATEDFLADLTQRAQDRTLDAAYLGECAGWRSSIQIDALLPLVADNIETAIDSLGPVAPTPAPQPQTATDPERELLVALTSDRFSETSRAAAHRALQELDEERAREQKAYRIVVDDPKAPFAIEVHAASLEDALHFAAAAPLQAWDFDLDKSVLDRIEALAREALSAGSDDEPCEWEGEHDCHQVARYFLAERLLGILGR